MRGSRRSFPTPWNAFTRFIGLSKLAPGSPFFARYNLTYLDENLSYDLDAVSGSRFPFPPTAYPSVYFLLFSIQTPIYGWFGVCSGRVGIKRKIVVAGFLSWLLLSVGALFFVCYFVLVSQDRST